jgi:protein involved in ribonucleotide reduction
LSGAVRAAVQNSGVSGAKTVIGTNDVSVNYIAFTATEDLGGGMSATGYYMMRNNLMTGESSSGQSAATIAAGNANWRNTYAAIAGGFGEVKAGRWGLAGLYGFDPFGATGTVMTFSDAIGGRYNSMGQYKTPTVSGFNATLGMTAQGVAATEEAAWAYVDYAAGALGARVLYEKDQALTATQREAYGAGLSYNLGSAKLMGGYAKISNVKSGATTSEQYNIGATMPFGAATAKLGYSHNKIGSIDMVGVGVDNALSKTTALFGDIGKNSANANATFQVGFQKYF